MDYAAAYGEMHRNQKYFPGYSLLPHAKRIGALIKATGARRVLDYGCGKGYQYLAVRVHESWGLIPYCYDIGVPPLSECPAGPFDGLICTDVLEHIEERDLPGIFKHWMELTGHSSWIFASISCSPAKRKTLPDGRNVHVTVRDPQWWNALMVEHLESRLLFLEFEDLPAAA